MLAGAASVCTLADRRWATLSQNEADGEVFVAVDEGVLVKIGDQVQVSVRRDYLTLDALERVA